MGNVLAFIKNFFLGGVLFGAGMGILFVVLYGVEAGLAAGTLGGAGFGLVMAIFVAFMHGRITRVQETRLKGQHVLRSGLANHMLGRVSDGGWLFLTDTKLHFIPHAINIQRSEVTIPLRDIIRAETYRTAGIIPNGLRVTATEGQESFAVNRHRKWKNAIRRAVELAKLTPVSGE